MRFFSRVLFGAALVVTMGNAGVALAGDTSTAEALFQQGLDAMKRNQYKEACDAFSGSNEADPSPGTEINLALCNEKQNKLASAWGWYRTAAGLAEQRGQKERADLARSEAQKIEPKLHKLVITVKSPPEGMSVTRNGAPVPLALLGTEAPIDPGDYTIEISAKGKKPFKQGVHINAGPGIDRVDVPPFEDAPAEAVAPVPGADTTTPPATGGKDGSTQRTIGLVVGGAGILALITAGGIQIFNLAVTNQDYKTVDGKVTDAMCDNPAKASKDCPNLIASRQSKDDARHANQTASLVVGIGGVAMLATGIVLLVTAPSGGKSADLRKPRLVPIFGSGTGGLGLAGTF